MPSAHCSACSSVRHGLVAVYERLNFGSRDSLTNSSPVSSKR
eukprot:XP_001707497.1 Hypothetical protein GL50803_38840 [Giardia lamblia ATCC 50803]